MRPAAGTGAATATTPNPATPALLARTTNAVLAAVVATATDP